MLEDETMKKNTAKRIRAVLFAILTVFLLYLTWTFAFMTNNVHNDWMANRYSVQERLYEAIGMYYAYVQLLVFAAVLLIFSICCLMHTVKPLKELGRIRQFIRQKGLYPAVGLIVLCILLLLLDRAALMRIKNTMETSEVPAALYDHILRGRLEIGTELAAIGAAIFFIMWIRGKKAKQPLDEGLDYAGSYD